MKQKYVWPGINICILSFFIITVQKVAAVELPILDTVDTVTSPLTEVVATSTVLTNSTVVADVIKPRQEKKEEKPVKKDSPKSTQQPVSSPAPSPTALPTSSPTGLPSPSPTPPLATPPILNNPDTSTDSAEHTNPPSPTPSPPGKDPSHPPVEPTPSLPPTTPPPTAVPPLLTTPQPTPTATPESNQNKNQPEHNTIVNPPISSPVEIKIANPVLPIIRRPLLNKKPAKPIVTKPGSVLAATSFTALVDTVQNINIPSSAADSAQSQYDYTADDVNTRDLKIAAVVCQLCISLGFFKNPSLFTKPLEYLRSTFA